MAYRSIITLSPEELGKIKQTNKAKDLQEIIEEEKIKQILKAKDLQEIIKEEEIKKSRRESQKDSNEDKKEDDNNSGDTDSGDTDDDYDPNFISGNDLSTYIRKKRKAVRPITSKFRSLDNQSEELEDQKEKVEEKVEEEEEEENEEHKEVDICKEKAEFVLTNKDDDEAFIHLIKTGYGHKKHMGQVNLKEADQYSKGDDPEKSFLRKIADLKQDRRHETSEGRIIKK